jgi:hypothetical protein
MYNLIFLSTIQHATSNSWALFPCQNLLSTLRFKIKDPWRPHHLAQQKIQKSVPDKLLFIHPLPRRICISRFSVARAGLKFAPFSQSAVPGNALLAHF